jgi:hypothetical protein
MGTSGETLGFAEEPIRYGQPGVPPGGDVGGGGGFSGGSFDDAISRGIAAGQRRLSARGVEPADGLTIVQIARQTDRVLSEWPADIPDRGVELLAEILIVGAASRVAYDEAPLTDDDARDFLPSLARTVNSWFHPPP